MSNGKIRGGGKLILIALNICIAIMTGSFAWGYWLAGYEEVARWIALFGILWIIAQWRKWRWFFSPAVFLSLLLAIIGVWLEFPLGWMFNGAAFGVFSWNLVEFQQRLKFLPPREDSMGMTRRHLLRVGLLAFGSIIFTFLLMIWLDL